MNSLNLKKGKEISDLEILFHLLNNLLDKKLEEKPKGGYIMGKGKDNEKRMKYTEAKERFKALYDYFAVQGTFSLGSCSTCDNWDSSSCSSGNFGKCRMKHKTTNYFDTCGEGHSYNGGGFGRTTR